MLHLATRIEYNRNKTYDFKSQWKVKTKWQYIHRIHENHLNSIKYHFRNKFICVIKSQNM